MEKQQQSAPTVRGQGILEWYEALISAALVLVLIFSFFFRIIQVDGRSMVPTLTHGDKLIVWAAGYTPQRGDVVIVDSYTVYGKPLVKRIIAKGGDTISIDYDAGTVTVNGEQYTMSAYPVLAEGTREIQTISRTSPSHLNAAYQNGVEDWLFSGSLKYKNSFDR